MTRYTIIFAVVIFITSCGNDSKAQSLSEDTTSFHGYWVSEEYINTLIRTKSPIEAGRLFGYYIPQYYKDYGYPFGGEGFRIIKHDKLFYMKFSSFDSTKIIFTDNEKRMNVSGKIYVKLSKDIADWGNLRIPETLIFKGKYKMGDKSVTFTDRKVSGIDKFKYFSIEKTYEEEVFGLDNIIYLGKISTEQIAHCFVFKDDTLLIYAHDCIIDRDGYCVETRRGQLKWTLIKE